MIVLSLGLGIITTAIDRNAGKRFRAVYTEQRAAYDAVHTK